MNDDRMSRITVLATGKRRRMYDFIWSRRSAISRDEAAAAVGISRKLAAFHLDKLVDVGLLTAHYARPAGRGGPGAGRPAKLYEAADVEMQVSVPERRYELSGQILLEALETRTADEDAQAAAGRIALRRGIEIGKALRYERGVRSNSRSASSSRVEEALSSYGFYPYTDGGALRLRNCPFHRLAQRSPETVCGMNRALIQGILEGLGEAGCEASIDPRPHECCVAVTTSSGRHEQDLR